MSLNSSLNQNAQQTGRYRITSTSTATRAATYMYRHNGRRRMDRKIDCSVSGNGVFSNVIGSWRSAYPVSFVVPGAPQTAPLHTPPSEADESIVLTMFSAEASPTPCVWDNPLRSCTRCSRADDVIRTPTGSSCVRSSCPSLCASITPPTSPSPRFMHISIKRIEGGCPYVICQVRLVPGCVVSCRGLGACAGVVSVSGGVVVVVWVPPGW